MLKATIFHVSGKGENVFPFIISRFITNDILHEVSYHLGKDDIYFEQQVGLHSLLTFPSQITFYVIKKTYLNGVGCAVSSLSLGWTKPLVTYFDVRAALLLAEAPEGPSNLIFLLTLRSHILLYFICPKNKYLCATLPISSTERHFSEGKASYMYIVSWNELAHSSLTPQGMLRSAQLGLSVTLRG